MAAPIEQIRRRGRQLVKAQIQGRVVRPQHDDAARRKIGQRSQHHRIDHTEDGGVRSDTKGQRHHRYSGEAGVFQKLADSELQVVHGFAILELRFAISTE